MSDFNFPEYERCYLTYDEYPDPWKQLAFAVAYKSIEDFTYAYYFLAGITKLGQAYFEGNPLFKKPIKGANTRLKYIWRQRMIFNDVSDFFLTERCEERIDLQHGPELYSSLRRNLRKKYGPVKRAKVDAVIKELQDEDKQKHPQPKHRRKRPQDENPLLSGHHSWDFF